MALRMGTLFNPALTKATPPRTTHAGQTLCTESADKPLANATNGGVDIELVRHKN